MTLYLKLLEVFVLMKIVELLFPPAAGSRIFTIDVLSDRRHFITSYFPHRVSSCCGVTKN